MPILNTRNNFRKLVFERDNHKCVICYNPAQDTHHIIDRKLFDDGGYYVNNGASLCSSCHIQAEKCLLSVEIIREKAGIIDIILPEGLSPEKRYDKWGQIMADFIKYPRTRHIIGSSLQKGDKDDYISYEELEEKHLVIEEKIDGANVGISFDEDWNLKLQSRGHYLVGGDYSQFDQFKTWANTYKEVFFDILGTRYIMYAEWMSNFHSLFYDELPHYFMEFDIYDTETETFLSTNNRIKAIEEYQYCLKIHQVLVLTEGICKNGQVNGLTIPQYVTDSHFQSRDSTKILAGELRKIHLEETRSQGLINVNNGLMEGLYIKWEEDGIVKDRYKFVRSDFTQTIIDGGQHHLKRPIIHNRLQRGASLY